MKESFRTELLAVIEGYKIDRYCHTPADQLTNWVCDRLEAKRIKVENITASRAKAQANGTLGRPKVRNDVAIRNLRELKWTYSEIANLLGISKAAVQRALKEKP